MESGRKTLVVTGGAGFIGSNTVKLLLDKGHEVRVIDDLSFGYERLVDPRAVFVKASIAEVEKLAQLLSGADAVIHFAASSIIKFSLEHPLSYIENNVVNGTKLLEAMRSNGVKKIVYSSSASVYGEPEQERISEDHPKRPMQPYGATKLAFENILSAYYCSYGIESVSLRYFNAYGPCDLQQPATRAVPMWIDSILKGKPVERYWNGEQVRDYVYVKDIAQAHVDVLDLPGFHAFNIGSGTGVKMSDLLNEIARIAGVTPVIKELGERAGDPRRLIADISSIKKAVGWEPTTSLGEGLAETLRYYTTELAPRTSA